MLLGLVAFTCCVRTFLQAAARVMCCVVLCCAAVWCGCGSHLCCSLFRPPLQQQRPSLMASEWQPQQRQQQHVSTPSGASGEVPLRRPAATSSWWGWCAPRKNSSGAYRYRPVVWAILHQGSPRLRRHIQLSAAARIMRFAVHFTMVVLVLASVVSLCVPSHSSYLPLPPSFHFCPHPRSSPSPLLRSSGTGVLCC